MREKRKFFRLPFEEKVEFVCPKGIFSGVVKNLSFGGLYIENPDNFPELKDEVALIFLLKDTDPPIKVFMKGRVVRIDEDKGFAIKFLSISQESFQHLRNYIIYNAPSPEIAELEIKKFLGEFDTAHQIVKAFNVFFLKMRLCPIYLKGLYFIVLKIPLNFPVAKRVPITLTVGK